MSVRFTRYTCQLIAGAWVLAILAIAAHLEAASDWTVYLHHAGPLTIGMSVDEARRALGDRDAHLAFGDREPDDAECSYLESTHLPNGLTVIFQRGKLARMDVWGKSDIHTA